MHGSATRGPGEALDKRPEPLVAPPLVNGVPTLVLRGVLDPFSSLSGDDEAAMAGAAHAFPPEIPNQSYNVLGYTECPRAIRNTWVDNPTSAPDTGCLAGIPALDLGGKRG